MQSKLFFLQLLDYESHTYSYLLADRETREAVLIDSVKEQVSRDLNLIKELGFQLKFLLETHVHADHITGASDLKDRTGAKIVLSAAANVAAADIAAKDGDEITFGSYRLRVITTQGHTDSCVSYFMPGYVFTGDVLMIRDVGRTDFQQGSNHKMYNSVTKKLFVLPDDTMVYPAHDYQGRTSSTIGDEKKYNIRLGGNKTAEQFEQAMSEMKLGLPKKIHIAVPANLRCGRAE